MLKAYFKNYNLILLIALAYSFSVLCRFYWIFWASNFDEFFFNNELMIVSNDGYAFAEGARDMIAGFHQANDLSYYGSSLSTLSYWLYRISPFSLESILIYTSIFMSSLIVLPLIFIAYEYKRPLMGFIGALLASIANSYYNRTMAGYYDTDMLVIVLAMFIVFFMIRLVLRKDALSLICLPLFVRMYLWWYPSSYTLSIALLACLFIYTLILHPREKILYLALILSCIALSNMAWFYQGGIIIILTSLFLLQNKYFHFAIMTILGLASLVFLVFSGGIDPILYQLKFYVLRNDAHSLDQTFMYFNVNQTIQEVASIAFSLFMQRISGSEIVFFVSLVGLILLIVKHKSMILSLPMLFLGFLALKSGLRFTIYAVPVLALGFGFLMSLLQESKYKRSKFINVAIFLLSFLSLVPMFYHIIHYKAPSVFSQNEVMRLDELKKIAQREDYVVAWWDYGYPIRYYSDVKTLVDGGKHLGRDNFFASFILSKDQRAAANMARLSVEYTEKTFAKNMNFDLLKAMMQDYDEDNVALFLASLSRPDFTMHTEKTRDIYIYMPARMSLIFSTVASFSFVNLHTGRIDKPFTFSIAYALDIDNEQLYLSNGLVSSSDLRTFTLNGKPLAINSIIELHSIEQGQYTIIPVDEQGQFYIFYLKNTPLAHLQFIIMDDAMFNSAYVQMFFLGNYDKNLYDLVISTDHTKIFKLKK